MARSTALLFLLAALSTSVFGTDFCRRGFVAPDRIVTALSVDSAAYGDFDEDGRIDVAFTTGYRLAVSINRGGGVFEPVSAEFLPSDYFEVRLTAATDVDRDGHLDLLIRFGNAVLLARGRGNGSFATIERTTLLASIGEMWHVIDFDHDGLIDFVDMYGGEFRFIRSRGDGTFVESAVARFVPLGSSQQEEYAVGDFDGDGTIDAFRTAYNLKTDRWVSALLWSASTGVPIQAEAPLPFEPRSAFNAVDLEGDGIEELVGTTADDFVVLRIEGRRLTYDAIPSATAPLYGAQRPVVGDLDDDGRRDLVFSYGTAVAFARRIDATHFAEPLLLRLSGSTSFTLVDIDADRRLDIVATRGHEGLSVIYGGTVGRDNPAPGLLALEFTPQALQLADIDGDGLMDLVANDRQTMTVTIMLADGSGGFRRRSTTRLAPAGQAISTTKLVLDDFDGDGRLDIAAGNPRDREAALVLAFGDGSGGFVPQPVSIDADILIGALPTPGMSGASLLVLRGDEVLAVRVSRTGEVHTTSLFTKPGRAGVFVCDADGDGVQDLVVASPDIVEVRTRSSGVWDTVSTVRGNGSDIRAVIAHDVNGDLANDLVLASPNGVIVHLRNGSSYERSQGFLAWGSLDDVAVRDVDGDTFPDIAMTTRHNFGDPGTIQIQRNDGLGHFSPYTTSVTGAPYGDAPAFGDIDGDGAIELLVPTFEGAEVHWNRCMSSRVRVAPIPATVRAGERVKLVIHVLATDAFAIGGITIRLGSDVVAWAQPSRSFDFATMVWTSGPLGAGQQKFTIEYDDQFAGRSTETIQVNVLEGNASRRRAVRR